MTAGVYAPPWRFSVSDYHRMGEAGIFTEDDRVELIEGEVVDMSPIGSRHAACVDKLAGLIRDRTSNHGVIIRVQNPIHLSEFSEPQPDISILRARDDFYAAAHPRPDDALLVIEVADASMMYDRNIKIPLYARSGITEVWLVDLVRNVVEVYSSPTTSGYGNQQQFHRGETAASIALPELTIAVDEILL